MATGKGTEETAWHALEEEEVREKTSANLEQGLSQDDAKRRLEETGPNTLEAERGTTPFQLILRQVQSPLIYLLAAAALVSLLIGRHLEAGVIGAIIILNSVLGFVQEWRAEKALEALSRMAAPKATVRRDGQEMTIDTTDVVPGDLLILDAGNRVAADARMLESDDLQTNEAALTGESEPVPKQPGVKDPDTPVAERENMVWMSTAVTSGKGVAVVVATGMNTAIGEIAGEVRGTERTATPLQKRIRRLSKILGILGVSVATLVFLTGFLRGYDLFAMLFFAIATAVSAIPEGLPAVVSVTLALGVRRMAERNALIRRLTAVEALGSATVICTDKTGTITSNEMTVTRVWAGGQVYEFSGRGFAPEGEITPQDEEGAISPEKLPEPLRRLLAIGALANDATVRQDGEQWHVDGDPTEGAVLVAARKAGIERSAIEEDRPRRDEIPFSSERQYMAVLYPAEDGEHAIVYVKGAPERMIAFAATILTDEEDETDIDETQRQQLHKVNETFAKDALRVLAGAEREIPAETEELKPETVERDLRFMGFWGMWDPPREAAIEAIGQAQRAGITVVMLTGDNPLTAAAVAAKVGITDGEVEAITGKQVDEWSPEEVAERALDTKVFARVSPAHKRKILEGLKGRGAIVAMTGDGVNDAPALKDADIGVAMGQIGTDVAKEAADMVLTDDNFATIVHAIEEGRVIYRNLRRVVSYLFITNLGEVLTLVTAIVIGLPLPLTPLQIIWVNLVTDTTSTIPLGIEPKHQDVLTRPPRDPKEPLVNRMVIIRIAILAPVIAAGTLGLFIAMLQQVSYEHARTMAFTTLATIEWFKAISLRSLTQPVFGLGIFTNHWLLIGIGTGVLLQLGVLYTALGQTLFATVPLSLGDWASIVAVASSVLIINEVFKWRGVYEWIERVVTRRRGSSDIGETDRRQG
ncbi:MAG: cation-translocating P-type ATPase [Armatimonadota bacterium]